MRAAAGLLVKQLGNVKFVKFSFFDTMLESLATFVQQPIELIHSLLVLQDDLNLFFVFHFTLYTY